MRTFRVLCIGGCVVDRIGTTIEAPARLHTSNIGRLVGGFGGAARNVAENLARLGVPVGLVSRVGADEDGARALAALSAAGVDVGAVAVCAGERTASYTAIFDGEGALVIGLADMAIFAGLSPADAALAITAAGSGGMVFIDANLAPETIAAIAAARPSFLAAGPVSEQKALRLKPVLPALDCLFLNRFEAAALTGLSPDDPMAQAMALSGLGVRRCILTADRDGAVLVEDGKPRMFAAPAAVPVNVNGAGDALAAATLARLGEGASLPDALAFGLAAAALTTETPTSVDPNLCRDLVVTRLERTPA